VTARRLPLLTAAAVVAADQLTKWWAVSSLPGNPIELIPGVLFLRYWTNSGAAFGLLRGAGSFIALGAIAAVGLIVLIVRELPGRLEALAMGLVLGGALGNLGDRLFRGPGLLDGRVVDFVDFRYFPAFNVADSAITVGAALALLAAFVLSREGGAEGGKEEEGGPDADAAS
jgi:signal peptidase II